MSAARSCAQMATHRSCRSPAQTSCRFASESLAGSARLSTRSTSQSAQRVKPGRYSSLHWRQNMTVCRVYYNTADAQRSTLTRAVKWMIGIRGRARSGAQQNVGHGNAAPLGPGCKHWEIVDARRKPGRLLLPLLRIRSSADRRDDEAARRSRDPSTTPRDD